MHSMYRMYSDVWSQWLEARSEMVSMLEVHWEQSKDDLGSNESLGGGTRTNIIGLNSILISI